MKKITIAIAAMCALLCASAVGCNGNNDSSTTNKNNTSVTPQEQLKTQDDNSSKADTDYVPVSVDNMSPIKTGWITLPGTTEYMILLNDPDSSAVNGYAYPDQPAEVYKEDDKWVLVKTRNVVGYLPKENFTTEEPAASTSQTASSAQ